MPFLNRLADRVQAFVKRLWSSNKGDSPARRSTSRARRTRPVGSQLRAKGTIFPLAVQSQRTKTMVHRVGRRRPTYSTPAPVRPPAATSRRQDKQPQPRRRVSSLSSETPPTNAQDPAPNPKNLPSTPRAPPPKSKRLPPSTKDLPPKPKRSPSKSKRLPPDSKALPPIPPAPQTPPHSEPAQTSYFQGAHNVGIGQQNIHHIQISSTLKTLFDYLDPHIAHGAAHNSDERCDAPKCHPKTRVAVQEEIIGWLRDGDVGGDLPKTIMWLSGPAGTGKTAIAGSVAETCKGEGLLAASFFFTAYAGSADRCSKRCVITTLASHLAEHGALHGFKEELLDSVKRNPSIFRKCLKEQAECLILSPLRSLLGHQDRAFWPTGIIIDGLDEVVAKQYHDSAAKREDEDDQREILDALFALSADPAFPFRILVSSRPERIIQDFFATSAQGSTLNLFLDSKYNPDADILRFLQAKFASIRRHCGISDLSWPVQATSDRLVEICSGQFIVATVIIRWVEGGVPQQRLDEVLQLERVEVGAKNPFATLDALYRHILTRAHNPDEDPHLVVKWIICITSSVRREMPGFPSKAPSARFWRHFLENFEGELNYRMGPIVSLISVSSPDTSSPITIYHKSLTDFLYSKTRSGDLYVSKGAYESFCADRIAIVLKNKGPAVPFPSPTTDLPSFLREFENLKLLVASVFAANDLICENFSKFLALLSEGAKNDLASCDVAWWTRLLLGKVAWHTQGSSKDNETVHYSLLGGIYCGIHKAMGCGSNALDLVPTPSTQDPTERGQDTGCHAACVHWRAGILAQAKEHNWCVHEMEQVEAAELERVTILEFDQKFKPMLQSNCAICHPNPSAIP